MIDDIVDATDKALKMGIHPRYFQSERGFQGKFYCALQQILDNKGLLQDGYILEMEYQKSGLHNTSQRPDIILHVPTEESGAKVDENNMAVWALKKDSRNETLVKEDFDKLDKMFEILKYQCGIFINIGSKNNFSEVYKGKFKDRLRMVAVWLEEEICTNWE